MKNFIKNGRAIQSGNVLFFILLAVALFGALSYAVTQGFRSGNADLSKDQAKLLATEILTYAKAVDNEVQRKLARGVSENNLCFDIDDYPGGSTRYEYAACADSNNRIFSASSSSGGVAYKAANTEALDSSFSANSAFDEWAAQGGYAYTDIGTSAVDLGFVKNFIKKDVCMAINNAVGIVNPSDNPPVDGNDGGSVYFKGVYGSGVANTIGDDGTGLAGQMSFCRDTNNPAGPYQFTHILIAR